MRSLGKIFIAIALAVAVFASCSRSKVIKKSDFKKIYAEMFIADQMLQTLPGSGRMADTSLVYESIFKKYGYTTADYQKSINYYMEDPMIFTRTIKQAGLIIDARIKELEKLKKEEDKIIAEKKRREEEAHRKEDAIRENEALLDSLLHDNDAKVDDRGFINMGGFGLPAKKFTMAPDSVAVDSVAVAIDTVAVAVDSVSVATDSVTITPAAPVPAPAAVDTVAQKSVATKKVLSPQKATDTETVVTKNTKEKVKF